MTPAPLRICVLVSSYEGSASPFKDVDPPPDPSRFLTGHAVTTVALHRPEVPERIAALVAEGYDVFFNLCDGMGDEDLPGLDVLECLEAHGAAFTGPDSAFFPVMKAEVKRVARSLGIDTPPEVFAFSHADVERAVAELPFPVIVKHFNGYASVGMTPGSRVTTPETLRTEAGRVLQAYGGALLEAFVEGREITVLVAENPDDPAQPMVYPPMEVLFPEGESFKHSELKWQMFDQIGHVPLGPDEAALAMSAMTATGRLFTALGGNGFARCDFRVDLAGRPQLLELNTLCGVFYPPSAEGCADQILLTVPDGHLHFADLLLRGALARGRRATSGVPLMAPNWTSRRGS